MKKSDSELEPTALHPPDPFVKPAKLLINYVKSNDDVIWRKINLKDGQTKLSKNSVKLHDDVIWQKIIL